MAVLLVAGHGAKVYSRWERRDVKGKNLVGKEQSHLPTVSGGSKVVSAQRANCYIWGPHADKMLLVRVLFQGVSGQLTICNLEALKSWCDGQLVSNSPECTHRVMTCRTGTGVLFLKVLHGESRTNTRSVYWQWKGGQNILGWVGRTRRDSWCCCFLIRAAITVSTTCSIRVQTW